MNTRRAAASMSHSRRPSTSQRRNPPSSITVTIAVSRRVRNAASRPSTSTGDKIVGNDLRRRINGTPCPGRCCSRRVGNPRGTGFAATSPRASRYEKNPETVDSRRATVRLDNAVRSSTARMLRPSPPARCELMNASTSLLVTAAGALPTTVKNTFKSNATASTVFGRQRADTNSR
jgi:hypothetical protein